MSYPTRSGAGIPTKAAPSRSYSSNNTKTSLFKPTGSLSFSGKTSPKAYPMSTYNNPTPSAQINFSPSAKDLPYVSSNVTDDSPEYDPYYFGQELENAIMLEKLGYDVSFNDGQMLIESPSESSDTYYQTTPYEVYPQSEGNLIYESDYINQQMQLASQYQSPSYGFMPNQYYSQYYSDYGQRYYDNAYQNGFYQDGYYDPYYRNNYRRQYNGRSGGYANRYYNGDSRGRLRGWY